MSDVTLANDIETNQAYILQINSEFDITDELVRVNKDIETTYEEETGRIFEYKGLKYFMILRKANGGFLNSIDFKTVLIPLDLKYGDRFMQYKDLFKDEVAE